MIVAKTSKDIKPVVKEGSEVSNKNPYYEIEDNGQLIYIIASGTNGSEFNKTVGYFSDYPGMQTYQCLYGQGVIAMQRNDEEGEAKEFKIVSLNPGKQVLVPASWGMCIANIGLSLLVVLRNSFLDEKHMDASPIIKKQGLAYFIVEKKGEVGFDENSNYLNHPQITTE